MKSKLSKTEKQQTENRPIKEEETINQMEIAEHEVYRKTAPMFAAYSGTDLLGKGVQDTFPAGRCVGGSENNNTARLLFKRHYGL